MTCVLGDLGFLWILLSGLLGSRCLCFSRPVTFCVVHVTPSLYLELSSLCYSGSASYFVLWSASTCADSPRRKKNLPRGTGNALNVASCRPAAHTQTRVPRTPVFGHWTLSIRAKPNTCHCCPETLGGLRGRTSRPTSS